MTRARTAAIYCDAEDGDCGAWDLDYDRACVSKVDGVPITAEAPAPGWTFNRTTGDDLCPEHSPKNEETQP